MVHPQQSRVIVATLAACATLLGSLCLPASSALAAPKAAAKGDEGVEITFIGYQALSGGRGLLFVELSESLVVEVNRAGPVIEYKLHGARVPLKNNRNPLLLRDFGSSALTAVLLPSPARKATRKAKAEDRSVRLVVTLRGDVSPAHRVVNRGNGAALEIELPAPKRP
jgi:hypothetical protein